MAVGGGYFHSNQLPVAVAAEGPLKRCSCDGDSLAVAVAAGVTVGGRAGVCVSVGGGG